MVIIGEGFDHNTLQECINFSVKIEISNNIKAKVMKVLENKKSIFYFDLREK